MPHVTGCRNPVTDEKQGKAIDALACLLWNLSHNKRHDPDSLLRSAGCDRDEPGSRYRDTKNSPISNAPDVSSWGANAMLFTSLTSSGMWDFAPGS